MSLVTSAATDYLDRYRLIHDLNSVNDLVGIQAQQQAVQFPAVARYTDARIGLTRTGCPTGFFPTPRSDGWTADKAA